MTAGAEDAARHLRDYFDLQLRFAEAFAARAGQPLADVVTWYTTFHRRFGLGILEGPPEAPAWRRYVRGLTRASGHAERVRWTLEFQRSRPAETPPPGRHVFGCFACDAPDDAGRLRIHFANRDRDGKSPLAADKVDLRRRELTAMFTFVRDTYPAAASVRGTSWLYHLDAYRRLFPPEYAGSRRTPEGPLHFHGSSSWGQLVDHRGRVKAAPRREFLANLPRLDPDRPRDVFPLPALSTSARIDVFHACYGIAAT